MFEPLRKEPRFQKPVAASASKQIEEREARMVEWAKTQLADV
jgi:hypothetical protein